MKYGAVRKFSPANDSWFAISPLQFNKLDTIKLICLRLVFCPLFLVKFPKYFRFAENLRFDKITSFVVVLKKSFVHLSRRNSSKIAKHTLSGLQLNQ